MAVVYFFWKTTIFDLVDEVLEDGDSLVIRNREQQEPDGALRSCERELLALSSCSASYNVAAKTKTKYFWNSNTLSVRAAIFLLPFFGSLIADDLIQRIDAACRASFAAVAQGRHRERLALRSRPVVHTLCA